MCSEQTKLFMYLQALFYYTVMQLYYTRPTAEITMQQLQRSSHAFIAACLNVKWYIFTRYKFL